MLYIYSWPDQPDQLGYQKSSCGWTATRMEYWPTHLPASPIAPKGLTVGGTEKIRVLDSREVSHRNV